MRKKARFIPSGRRADLGVARATVVGDGIILWQTGRAYKQGTVPKQLQNISQGFHCSGVRVLLVWPNLCSMVFEFAIARKAWGKVRVVEKAWNAASDVKSVRRCQGDYQEAKDRIRGKWRNILGFHVGQ